MHTSIWQATRVTRAALVLIWVALTSACSDDVAAPTRPPTRAPNLAMGDVITVTTATDGPDLTGSLRWAVKQATGGETIRFAPELAGATITLDSVLVVYKPLLTIEGPADKGITISAGGKGRVMAVNTYDGSSATLTTLRNLSITGGKLSSDGGAGISVGSPLVLEHVTLFGNEAPGPVIYQAGYSPSFVTLVNSTMSGNVSASYPVISTAGDLTLINSTVAENAAQGGVFTGAGSKLTLRNSIVAHNGGKSCEVGIATVSAEGKNIADDASCGDAAVTMVADPKLEPLAMNGGPAQTHALAPTSPAVNAGKDCTVTVDQRYQPRDAQCDIGAFELTNATAVTLTIDAGANVDLTTGYAYVRGTVKCSRAGDAFALAVQLQQQKTDNAPSVVRGAGEVSVSACSTVAKAWSATVIPAAGAFRAGAAAAQAATHETASWVTPATASRSVSLVRTKK